MTILPLYGQGVIEENPYIIECTKTGNKAIIDPGFMNIDNRPELDNIKYIILTHGHFDHILAADELRKKFGAKIVINKFDDEMLQNPSLNLSSQFGLSLSFSGDILLTDGDVFTLGETEIKLIHTPGHTKGSSCFYVPEEELMFTGDTIFSNSIGRTDFPSGNISEMVESINKLDSLDINPVIYSGHGECARLKSAISIAKMYL